MATKLFLRNTQDNAIGATYYDLITTAGSSVDTAVVNTAASGTEIQFTKTAGGAIAQWITGRAPSGGFTLTSADISVWAEESVMGANSGGRFRLFHRSAAGTETEIGGGPFDDGVEFIASPSGVEMTWTGNNTDQAFAENDRLLLKLYITNIGVMGGGETCTLKFNDADGTTFDSFLTIAETVAFKAESVAIAAAASITEAAETVSAAASLSIVAAGAITEAGDTLTAAGAATPITADAAITEAGDTVAAAGTIPIVAAASITEAGDALAADGSLPIVAAASITETGDTVSSAGSLAIVADASIAEAADTLSADGVGPSNAANAAITEAADALSAAGSVTLVAAAAITEAADTLSATGVLPIVAVAIIEAGDTLSATGVGPSVNAAASITEAGDTLSAAGAMVIVAALASVEAGDTISVTATLTTPGVLSDTFIRAVLSRESSEVIIVLLTIDHPDLDAPIRVARNSIGFNITSRGLTFTAFPFEIDLVSDDDREPTARLRIANVDRTIGDTLMRITSPATATIEIVLASSPDIVEKSFTEFDLTNVTWDAISVQAELSQITFYAEPWPGIRVTPSLFPAIYL